MGREDSSQSTNSTRNTLDSAFILRWPVTNIKNCSFCALLISKTISFNQLAPSNADSEVLKAKSESIVSFVHNGAFPTSISLISCVENIARLCTSIIQAIPPRTNSTALRIPEPTSLSATFHNQWQYDSEVTSDSSNRDIKGYPGRVESSPYESTSCNCETYEKSDWRLERPKRSIRLFAIVEKKEKRNHHLGLWFPNSHVGSNQWIKDGEEALQESSVSSRIRSAFQSRKTRFHRLRYLEQNPSEQETNRQSWIVARTETRSP